ncbi:Uncharacterised protein [Serratia fonticola]|uniref:Uncharacterized protein n=1 Tax=Serratia fonticola TaxID=47917 RepID=A0A4U9W3R6_SERFO|nr:Uncharacterised protein [Serratia fonticola]
MVLGSDVQWNENHVKVFLYAGTPENFVTKAKDHMICMTLNKLRIM